MNTALDVNIAIVIPLVYVFHKIWRTSKKTNEKLVKKNLRLTLEQEEPFVYLKEGNTRHKVFIKEILYVESLKNYVKVKTTEHEIIAYKSLSAMQESLPAKRFIRVHRSFIVAIDHITTFSPSQVNIKGIIIPVGRKYKESVKKSLGY